MEEIVIFALAVGLAVVLIALAGMAAGALGQAASGLVDWHRAKNAYPILFYAGGSGNARVHLCVNATEVWIVKGNVTARAEERYLAYDGRRWIAHPQPPHGGRWGVDVVYCQSYLGEYRVGDVVEYLVKVGRTVYFHSYTLRRA